MITYELISANALLTANVLLLGAAAIELLRLKRVVRRCDKARSNPPPVAAATTGGDSDTVTRLVDQRIAALEKIADNLARNEQRLQQSVRHNAPHESAVRLARSGASADDLTRACGLNKGEAELMIRLYAGKPAA